MKLFTIDDIDNDERIVILNYFEIHKRYTDFGNDCTPQTMIDLFGETRGKKLWGHFVHECQRSLTKWHTYLSKTEKDVLWVQLLKYEFLTKGILA